MKHIGLKWRQIHHKNDIGSKNEWYAETPGLLWDYCIIQLCDNRFYTYHYDERFDNYQKTLDDAMDSCQKDWDNVLESLRFIYED